METGHAWQMITRCGGMVVLSLLWQEIAYSSVKADVGERTVPVYEIPLADIPDFDDGSFLWWEDVLPGASLHDNDFRTEGGVAPSPYDLGVRVFLAWSDDAGRLFVGVNLVDDVIVSYKAEETDGSLRGDHFEIMIDGDHSGGWYDCGGDQETDKRAEAHQGTQVQRYTIAATEEGGWRLVNDNIGLNWTAAETYTRVNGGLLSSYPNDFMVEMYLTPWDEVIPEGPADSKLSEVRSGSVIGLQMVVVDVDGDVETRYTLAGSQGANEGCSSDGFVDALIVPCFDSGDCGTEVHIDAWARIKAGLLVH